MTLVVSKIEALFRIELIENDEEWLSDPAA